MIRSMSIPTLIIADMVNSIVTKMLLSCLNYLNSLKTRPIRKARIIVMVRFYRLKLGEMNTNEPSTIMKSKMFQLSLK